MERRRFLETGVGVLVTGASAHGWPVAASDRIVVGVMGVGGRGGYRTELMGWSAASARR